jgi:hypothetical protein
MNSPKNMIYFFFGLFKNFENEKETVIVSIYEWEVHDEITMKNTF